MPFFTDAEVRQRLKSVGQLASAPEQANYFVSVLQYPPAKA